MWPGGEEGSAEAPRPTSCSSHIYTRQAYWSRKASRKRRQVSSFREFLPEAWPWRGVQPHQLHSFQKTNQQAQETFTLSGCLEGHKDAGPGSPLEMPVGLWEPSQLDRGHLLLLGTCGAKVRFMSPVPERKMPRAGPLRANMLYTGIHGASWGRVRPWSETLGSCPDAAVHQLCNLCLHIAVK